MLEKGARHWATLLVFLMIFQQTLAFAGGQKGMVRIKSVSKRQVKLKAGAPPVKIKIKGQNLDAITSAVVLLNNRPTGFVKAFLGPPHKNRRNIRLRATKNAPTKCCYTIQVRAGGFQTVIPPNLLRIETISTAAVSPLLSKSTKRHVSKTSREKTTASTPVVKNLHRQYRKPRKGPLRILYLQTKTGHSLQRTGQKRQSLNHPRQPNLTREVENREVL